MTTNFVCGPKMGNVPLVVRALQFENQCLVASSSFYSNFFSLRTSLFVASSNFSSNFASLKGFHFIYAVLVVIRPNVQSSECSLNVFMFFEVCI